MKKGLIAGIMSAAVVMSLSGVMVFADEGGVPISEENFPDAKFRNFVSSTFDSDMNGTLSDEEISAATSIDVIQCGISSLQGIEYFTSLNKLECCSNHLTSVDLSHNTALQSFNCFNNSITYLNLDNCSDLVELCCCYNQLENLDLSDCVNLQNLTCHKNNFTSIDISSNTAITYLNCSQNKITNLDVSNCTSLIELYCAENNITNLNVNGCTSLTTLFCQDNSLTELDLSTNTVLKDFSGANNQIAVLDITANDYLKSLYSNTPYDYNGSYLYGSEITHDRYHELNYNVYDKVIGYGIGIDGETKYFENIFHIDKTTSVIASLPTPTPIPMTEPIAAPTAAPIAVPTATPVPTVSPKDNSFVERLYNEILGRESDAAGKAFWKTQLANGMSEKEVALRFFFSPEYQEKCSSDSKFVSDLYFAFLNRTSDKAGFNYWSTELASGVSREDILTRFMECDEFVNS